MNGRSLAVFISGQGSNLNVFLQNKDKFKKIFVVSSNPKAYGLVRARNHGLTPMVLDPVIHWPKLLQILEAEEIDLIFLAGFMKIVPTSFLQEWKKPILNLHPSLLPKYKGLHAIKQAYEKGDDIGASIHEVVAEVDGGKVLIQQVAVTSEEAAQMTLDKVTEKVQQCEHKMVKKWMDQWLEESF